MSGLNPKWLIGRTIVAVEMNPQNGRERHEGHARVIVHDPVITLDNGAKLTFFTEETDFGFYGTDIVYHRPPRNRKQ